MAGNLDRKLLSTSPEATLELARRLGAALPAGAVVALDGDLGSGKTLFVRGLAEGLGIEDDVSSPTYTLMHEYVPGAGGRGLALYHLDAWMEGRERAFLEGGGVEWLDAGGVCVVEWAARVAELLPRPRLALTLAHAGPEARRVDLALLRAGGARAGLEALLEAALAGLELPPGLEESRGSG